MRELRRLWKETKQTLWEFQAGPKRNDPLTRRKVRTKAKRMSRAVRKRFPRTARSITARSGGKQGIKRTRPAVFQRQPPAPWERHDEVAINDHLPRDVQADSRRPLQEGESAQSRVETLVAQRKNKRQFYPKPERSGKQKELRFMNPGTEKIMEAVASLKSRAVLPSWATHFEDGLTLQGNKLLFEGKEMLTTEGKRNLIKLCYFDPKQPATQRTIYEHLEGDYANLTRSDVIRVAQAQEGDALLFYAHGRPLHLGFALNNQDMLHIDSIAGSRVERWRAAAWLGKLEGIYRFA